MAAERLLALHRDKRFDLVIVDTPPTRNALDFLDAPSTLARFLDHPVFKLMMMPTRRGLRVLSVAAQPMLRSIGKVIGSEVLADALAFFQAFDGMETGFRNRADEVIALLHGDRHAVRAGRLAAGRHDRRGPLLRRPAGREGSRGRRDHRQPGDARLRRARRASGRGALPTRRCTTTRRSSTSSPSASTRRSPRWSPTPAGNRRGCRCCPATCTTSTRSTRSARCCSPVQRLQRRAGRVDAVHILVATDADYVLNDVTAALGGPDVSFTVCRNGRDVSDVVEERTPDLVVLDLQIGSMGGMAVTMALRLDESSRHAAPREGADAARPPEPTSTWPSAAPPTVTWSSR